MTANSTPEPQGTAPWKSRPVFISSTFKDLQRERDWLSHSVFPRLREDLAKRHHHLEPIDLRLGVKTAEDDSEEARELLVLKVCLDEIKSSRPFLLVLLGDRYGWVPPEERIEAAVFRRLRGDIHGLTAHRTRRDNLISIYLKLPPDLPPDEARRIVAA